MPFILMYGSDDKSRLWAQSLKKHFGVEVIRLKRYPILSPLTILWTLATRGRPRGIVFRYLNDYPSLVKSVLRLTSELLVVLIAKLLRIRVAWICHNVDRETSMYHPRITTLRRKIIGDAAVKVYVTDPGLLRHAERLLPEYKNKLDYVTFGRPGDGPRNLTAPSWWRDFESFVESSKSNLSGSVKRLIGLSFGHASWKTVHYEQTKRLLDAAWTSGYDLRLIILGPIREFLEKYAPDTLRELMNDRRVFLVDQYVKINEAELVKYVDFYWRAYRDYSVPYGMYCAAHYKKPVLTYDVGFLSEAVRIYSLGAVISIDFSNIRQALDAIAEWDETAAERFLESHTWEEGARRLIRFLEV